LALGEAGSLVLGMSDALLPSNPLQRSPTVAAGRTAFVEREEALALAAFLPFLDLLRAVSPARLERAGRDDATVPEL